MYRNYSSSVNDLLTFSHWANEKEPHKITDFIESVRAKDGQGNEAIEVGLWFVNQQIDEGVDVTQVLLIGDAKPNTEHEVRDSLLIK